MSSISDRLHKLGIVLPQPPKPVASYVGFVVHGDLVFVSGQLPFVNGKLGRTGLVGSAVSVEDAAGEARTCAINLLAQAAAACNGNIERLSRCIRLGGFVACAGDFADHPKVINGASDLIGEVLGESGRHARTSIGVSSLPMNACVEVDAVFSLA